MQAFAALLAKEFRWLWRSYRLLAVTAVFFILGLSGPLILYFLPDLIQAAGEDIVVEIPDFTAGDAVGEYLGNITQMGAIAVILVTMGAVAAERSSGTAVFTLSKPVSFELFVLAKCVALLSLLSAGVLVGAAAAFIYTAVLFEAPSVAEFLGATALTLLLLSVIMSLTLIGSCVSRSQLLAGGIGLVSLVVLGVFGAIPVVSDYTPFGLAGWAASMAREQDSEPVWAALGLSALITVAAPWAGSRLLAVKEL